MGWFLYDRDLHNERANFGNWPSYSLWCTEKGEMQHHNDTSEAVV